MVEANGGQGAGVLKMRSVTNGQGLQDGVPRNSSHAASTGIMKLGVPTELQKNLDHKEFLHIFPQNTKTQLKNGVIN